MTEYPPPIGYVLRDGVEHFDAAEDWARLCERGLQFADYSGPSSVRMARGTCLNPLITAGDLLSVRPLAEGERLVDGGLYVIEWANEAEVQTYRDSINLPSTEAVLITKFLRFIAGDWWCQCKDSVARLDGTVIAMVACTQEGQSVRSAQCGQLGPNAATVIQTATAASVTITPVSTFIQVASITVGPYGDATTIVLTASAQWQATTGINTDTFTIQEALSLSTGVTGQKTVYKSPLTQPTSTNTQGQFTDEGTFALAANTTTTYALWAQQSNGNPTTSAVVFSGVTFKAEVIRR